MVRFQASEQALAGGELQVTPEQGSPTQTPPEHPNVQALSLGA